MRKDELCDVNGNASKALETGTQKLKDKTWSGIPISLPDTQRHHSSVCRFLNITFAFPGKRAPATERVRGTPLPSSNLISYVATIWANRALISLTAKNRPGLIGIVTS